MNVLPNLLEKFLLIQSPRLETFLMDQGRVIYSFGYRHRTPKTLLGIWQSKNELEGKEQGNREPNLTTNISTNQYPRSKCLCVCYRGVGCMGVDRNITKNIVQDWINIVLIKQTTKNMLL